MDNLNINIRAALDLITESVVHDQLVSSLQVFQAKQIWTPHDRHEILETLAKYLIVPSCTISIGRAFRPLILDLLDRTLSKASKGRHWKYDQHEQLCIALGKLVHITPDALSFTIKYFQTAPPFFQRLVDESNTGRPPPLKKIKTSTIQKGEHCDLAVTAYRFLSVAPDKFRDLWNWSPFMQLVQDEDAKTRWFVTQSIAIVLRMTDLQRKELNMKLFTTEDIRSYTLRSDEVIDQNTEKAVLLTNPKEQVATEVSDALTHTQGSIVSSDLSDTLVSLCGVVLQKISVEETPPTHLVPVPSTLRNLHSLALAVANNQPVLLEGPVGCGKTALVEHLAAVTGRVKTPHLMKVQLGDQTDSKALLGTYRCTDVPGEFVWQAGALTQAVTQGHWILLEDIDYAPMDVVSVLVPLLESNTLSIPGHGDTIRAVPGFQLFASQRLLSSTSGLYKQHNSNSTLLERMWTKISVEPLSRDELKEVIVTLYPGLLSVVDKLLDIYSMLSAGRHDLNTDTESSEEFSAVKIHHHESRPISTRDLVKWCARIVSHYEVVLSSTANMVFQEALDCFCSMLSKPTRRLMTAEAIGAKINISKEKASFYCEKYKPNIEITASSVQAGRAVLPRKEKETASLEKTVPSTFAHTRHTAALIERVAVCVANSEPVLLVGETGTGKTSSVQYLAEVTGHRLKVINMNQQSDSTDLLGGYKPVDVRQLVAPFREHFESVFCQTFSRKQNAKFLGHIQDCFGRRKWDDLFKLMGHVIDAAQRRSEQPTTEVPTLEKTMPSEWQVIGRRLQQLKTQVKHAESALAFSFIEGTLVKALRRGDWVLLDEINLATAETLECLGGLLESKSGSVVLLERGDTEPIMRHEDFRLFACMNPATDVGKKDLPAGIRNRFTEFFVDELEEISDLKVLVNSYLEGLSLSAAQVEGIVKFYLIVRNEAVKKLTDGTGHRPHYSLRTLCRALRQAASNPYGNIPRCLYESFCLSFLTQLDRSSHPVVEQLICKHIIGRSNIKSVLKQPLPPPAATNITKIEGYWVSTGDLEPVIPKNYILTPSVRANLRDLCRITSAGRYPVLLQGETSVGKTSLVSWLAKATGNHCVRVNNHEHTDLQEYVGFYAADETGKLVFKEGVLVSAMRKGHWIILDELNLAPTDVLEALNRLLDDNRELFIPETQETVKAHKRFMLFATQNPPGLYGGRKVLSRAFRNRFVELHFDEIPSRELETILHQRCEIPLSYCKRMVSAMLDLQARRRGSGVFAGKQGYITLRDLFRWAERYSMTSSEITQKFYDWDQHIADEGFMLLAGKVRRFEEQLVIQEVLQKHIKRKVDPVKLFSLSDDTSATSRPVLQEVMQKPPQGFSHIVWTYGMRRLAVLAGQAMKFKEPVLLVGDTGCGKTTICQLYAALAKQKLYTVNCHLHTETSDFLGGLRPVRHRAVDEESEDEQRLFEWCDGPLVLAMREGAAFLVDEISLADDSVLERLNSVLEPEKTLLLAEKGSGESLQSDVEQIVAMETFKVVATMNPGGDFGKKELSPALRNRFTEIWCPQSNDREDLVNIIEHNLAEGIQLCNQEDGTSGIGNAIMDFMEWFSNNEVGKRCTVSIRDMLSWVDFINTVCTTDNSDITGRCKGLEPSVSFIHGACLVFLDGLGTGTTSGSSLSPNEARTMCLRFLQKQIFEMTGQAVDMTSLIVNSDPEGAVCANPVELTDQAFGIQPFFIPRGPAINHAAQQNYTLHAPTTAMNAQRLLRAMQLPRAILLEGSPGVGKTSLVTAMAKASGHEYVRINLSEQTDVTDLFGADLPVEGGEGGQFAWRDGPLLRALKAGHWVVLDELNLASQSVLEGLNACLDHRAEVFVPELGKTFHIQHRKTRIFACQNPLNQGGGRKGLPKSFLNRFTQVHIEPLSAADLLFITHTVYPTIGTETLKKMIHFSNKLYDVTMVACEWGQRGGPWEFNLRDLFRWCDLMVKNQDGMHMNPGEYVNLIYAQRMRSKPDKEKVLELYTSMLCHSADKSPWEQLYQSSRYFHITPEVVQAGHSFLLRSQQDNMNSLSLRVPLKLLHHLLEPLEALMTCIDMNWMAILVGPHSSGKTSLVKLLAQLTGHTLHVMAMNSAMDTTELLGGFEQADLNRHWEQLTQQFQCQVLAAIRYLMLKCDKKCRQQAQQLLNTWFKFYENFQCGSVCEGHWRQANTDRNVKEAIRSMDKVLSLVEKLCKKYDISDVKEELSAVKFRYEELRRRFENDILRDGKGGGKFEWVDGLLVQALQSGEWLLIDNVNFCSPSVLDRLNALLEPDGELSINERGVIDGEIPTIKPHPNFRLILAMDPRNGEISRAMRNRGVEIYILGENEGGKFGSHDLKSLLHGIGLVGQQPCQVLIELHTALRTKLTGAEPCSLLDLLHAASLTVQELHRGNHIISAMFAACINVYVRGQGSYANRQVAKQVIEEHLLHVDFLAMEREKNLSVLTEEGQWPDSLPSIQEYSNDSELATIRRQSCVFLHLLNQLSLHRPNRKELLTLTELSGKTLKMDVQETSHLEKLLLPAMLTFVELSSVHDWRLRLDYICDVIRRKLPSVKSKKTRLPHTYGNEFMQHLPDTISHIMDSVFSHELMKKLQCAVREMGLSESDIKLLASFPYDMQWNVQLQGYLEAKINKLRISRMDTDKNGSPMNFDTMRSITNRLYIVMHRAMRQYTENTVYVEVNKKQQANTLIQLSFAFNKGFTAIESLPDPVIVHLYPFFVQFDQHIASCLQADLLLTEDGVNQVLEALSWRDRLWDISNQSVLDRQHMTLSQLSLHWNWVFKKTLFTATEYLAGRDAELPSELSTVVSRILQSLTNDTRASQAQLIVWRDLGFPVPYKSAIVADLTQHVHKLCQCIDVFGNNNDVAVLKVRQDQEKRIRFHLADRQSVCRQLEDILMEVYSISEQGNDNIDNLLNGVDTVESLLVRHQLYDDADSVTTLMEVDRDPNETMATEGTVSDAECEMRVQLWPVYEWFGTQRECQLLVELLSRNVSHSGKQVHMETAQRLEKFHQYRESLTPWQPLQLILYRKMADAKHSQQNIRTMTSEALMTYLQHLWSSSVTRQPNQWLAWKPAFDKDSDATFPKRNSAFNIENGPGSLYLSTVGIFSFHLLLQIEDHHQHEPKQPRRYLQSHGLSLGKVHEKITQIQRLSEFLWTNGSSIADTAQHYRSNNWNLLAANLANLIYAVRSFVYEENRNAFINGTNLLSVTSDEVTPDGLINFLNELIQMLPFEEETRRQNLFDPHKSSVNLPAYVEDLLRKCIDCIKMKHMSEIDQRQADHIGQSGGSGLHGCYADQLHCGLGWVHLGLLQSLLLAPQGPVDPAEKTAIKLKYNEDEFDNLDSELTVRDKMSELLTGQTLNMYQDSVLPPRVKYLQRRQTSLKEMAADLAKKTACRPVPSKFDVLLQDIGHFTSSIGSLNSVQKLVDKLMKAFGSQKPRRGMQSLLANILQEEQAWQRSVNQFIARMEKEYPMYKDLTVPFLSGVAQLSHGMRTLAHAVFCKDIQAKFQKSSSTSCQISSVQDLLLTLVRFPYQTRTLPSSLSVAEALCEENTLQLIDNIESVREKQDDAELDDDVKSVQFDYKAKLLKVALLHTCNHALQRGQFEEKTLELLKQLLDAVVTSWKEAEEEARRKEEEEAQLYKYRVKEHGDGLTEEEREEQEFRRSFPTFHKDFEDMTEPPSLESNDNEEKKKDLHRPRTESSKTDVTEMAEVCKLHQVLYCGLTRTHWLYPTEAILGTIDYVEPFSLAYQISRRLVQTARPATDSSLDIGLLGGHLLMGRRLQTMTGLQSSEDNSKETKITSSILFNKPFDIYHDSNTEQAVQCRPLMEKFLARIRELLAEWPDHPTLKQLVEVINRIMAFPVTSPLMKFVTGLEVLLLKAQEWEANASRAVSVLIHLDNITQMIIQLRKIELSCWSSCLDMVVYRYALKACKKWYYVYQLIEYHLNTSNEDNEDNAAMECDSVAMAPDDEESGDKMEGLNKFVTNLHQFIEGSSVGEFSVRLQMLMTFHCQVIHAAETPDQGKVMTILWNVHQYYKQFLPAVEKKLQELRKPFEKELKGFVKIARWSDMNFWAMKQYVEKSHRTLHKFSKKFESALLEPARNLFMDSNIGEIEKKESPLLFITASDISIGKFVSSKSLQTCFEEMDADNFGEGILQRLPTLFAKMTKLCSRMFKNSLYPSLITSLDEFTGNIVEMVHQLQALDVSKDADKEKQKSEAKHINLRKRKSLADLFKYLSLLGLSYRKGLMYAKQRDQNSGLQTAVTDLSVAFKHSSSNIDFHSDQVTSEAIALWEGCQLYYYRCIARSATMHAAMVTPSKELGVSNIDRCKGFSEHLIKLCHKQREDLAEIVEGATSIRNHLSTLENLQRVQSTTEAVDNLAVVTYDTIIPPQKEVCQWICDSKEMADMSMDTLQQFELILHCCPEKRVDSVYPSPIPQCDMAEIELARKGDSTWTEVFQVLQSSLSVVKTVKEKLDSLTLKMTWCDGVSSLYIVTWSEVKLLSDVFQDFQNIHVSMEKIVSFFSVSDGKKHSPLISSLVLTIDDIRDKMSKFSEWLDSTRTLSKGDNTDRKSKAEEFGHRYQDEVEAVVTRILVTIQKMVKSRNPKEKDDGADDRNEHDDNADNEEGIAGDLQESHLNKLVDAGLEIDHNNLDIEKTNRSVFKLISNLKSLRDSCQSPAEIQECNRYASSLIRIMPLLHQYSGVVHHHLTMILASHRTTCKLLSVLLGIFSELATKGFCMPAELSDEAGGEGATQFEDTAAGGIGDGEGVKDVSDQIENEDQVQDVKKPGDEEKEDNFDDQPDIEDEKEGIEMSDDFEGKLHDVEKTERDEGSEGESEDDENELDKQMGDVGDENEKLDERMWGSDDEDDGDGDEDEDKKQEDGPGMDEEKTQTVAKDDNQGAVDDDDENKKRKDEEEETKEKDVQPHNLEPKDESEFDDDKIDPNNTNREPTEEPEDLDLPDDLNLDGKDNDDEKSDDDTEQEENPFDIENEEKTEMKDVSENDAADEEEAAEEAEEVNLSENQDREQSADQEEEEDEIGEEKDDRNMDVDDNDDEVIDENENDEEEEVSEDKVPPPKDENQMEEDDVRTDEDKRGKDPNETKETAEAAEDHGKTDTSNDPVQLSDNVEQHAGKSEEKDKKEEQGTGTAESEKDKGHEGDLVSERIQSNTEQQQQHQKRKPGQSSSDRSLGSTEEKIRKGLKIVDQQEESKPQTERDSKEQEMESDLYEHMKDSTQYDKQTLDAATQEQQQEEQAVPNMDSESDVEAMETGDENDVQPLQDAKDDSEAEKTDSLPLAHLKSEKETDKKVDDGEGDAEQTEDNKGDGDGETDESEPIKERNRESTIHTARDVLMELESRRSEVDVERLRFELTQQLTILSSTTGTSEEEKLAQETWHRYESLTSSLSQELCEQLRLVLEPSQATKLRGDYRTGKRLNMRKVIPYIASQFRKDKIWLRRTKPSKRNYQIMLAVDDSSSMADNRSKQLAFESMSVISNALTWLEAGELAICSFGESVQLLHPFEEQFTSQCGARMLQQFTFEQKKTKIAELLNKAISVMMSARMRQHQGTANIDTSQLLLIVSDGRGLFLEGMEAVKSVVRAAREAHLFIVFVVLDNPDNKDSILDIKVPIFKSAGEMPEIKAYMEQFPFPFYIILRDINALPSTLSDALRQWFELVTADTG
ncbi:LOW QUALITY PROTEIN: midasin-like [Ptychodera flava]|uniref:LOW QUALITY PROTEIN: midasin-like n=1 Tax=Ptychodera flava TaxID=63121 RepID=UPI00396A81D3